MLRYVSNKGGVESVDFETAILDGFAGDGGLYVPERLPEISEAQLQQWAKLSYVDLAFEILSLFIDRSIMTEVELRELLRKAYAPFEKKSIIPLQPLQSRKETYIMELFHGPTISFKDVGLAFLVNLVDFFLERKNEKLSIIVATTGDTGPATAYFSAGKKTLDTWVLYPKGMVTEEQERQMTTLKAPNIHAVGVSNCPDGADDLDLVIARLFANKDFKEKVKLSSVNSINWGRVMMQTVHYFYGYFQVVDVVGEKIHMSVPSGAFGNLCAGSLARMMGLPVDKFISANNENACLHRLFSEGVFSKKDIIETVSSAIDILIPYNFWRYLYFAVGQDSKKINGWMKTFSEKGIVRFDNETHAKFSKGYLSSSLSDEATLNLIKDIYNTEGYLLDPHAAVAVGAAERFQPELGNLKIICLATAHPAKFPETIQRALGASVALPEAAFHPSLEAAKKQFQRIYCCECADLEEALLDGMSI